MMVELQTVVTKPCAGAIRKWEYTSFAKTRQSLIEQIAKQFEKKPNQAASIQHTSDRKKGFLNETLQISYGLKTLFYFRNEIKDHSYIYRVSFLSRMTP